MSVKGVYGVAGVDVFDVEAVRGEVGDHGLDGGVEGAGVGIFIAALEAQNAADENAGRVGKEVVSGGDASPEEGEGVCGGGVCEGAEGDDVPADGAEGVGACEDSVLSAVAGGDGVGGPAVGGQDVYLVAVDGEGGTAIVVGIAVPGEGRGGGWGRFA